MRKGSFLFFVALSLLFVMGCRTESEAVISGPIIWDVSNIDQLKSDSFYQETYKSIINSGYKICSLPPVNVMKKEKTFAPDKHFFCSLATYWWPDPENPVKYLCKDGISNPEVSQYDGLNSLANRCMNLSVSYYLTRNPKFYNAFIIQLRTWFIDQETYMYPNFTYAQVIPGRRNNKGRSTGFIGAYPFNNVIESIRLVNSVKRIDNCTVKALQKWFYEFAEWADKGEYSQELHNGSNNIGLAYDVTLVNMYFFAGKGKRAMEIASSFKEKRLLSQIAEDGSQPEELKRSKAFTYSLFNITHILDFFYLARSWDKDYINNGKRLEKAFEYLSQFIGHKEKFPYRQISSWENCENTFDRLKIRYAKLKGVKVLDHKNKECRVIQLYDFLQ